MWYQTWWMQCYGMSILYMAAYEDEFCNVRAMGLTEGRNPPKKAALEGSCRKGLAKLLEGENPVFLYRSQSLTVNDFFQNIKGDYVFIKF